MSKGTGGMTMDRGNSTISEKNLSQFHTVHHKPRHGGPWNWTWSSVVRRRPVTPRYAAQPSNRRNFSPSSLIFIARMNQEHHPLTYLLTYLLTYSMVQSPSWEANWSAASQETPRISWNPKVHYRTHKRPPPVSILGQPNAVHIHTTHLLEIRSNIIPHLRLGLPSGLLPSGFPTKTLYTPLSSPIRATCPAHLILLDFITRTILGEEYKSFSSSLCSLLNSPVTSSLLGPNVLKHPQLPFLQQCQRPCFTPIQNNRQNYSSIYLDL